eukprot:Clim_evm56s152 gene=Clim_evmTU56s152
MYRLCNLRQGIRFASIAHSGTSHPLVRRQLVSHVPKGSPSLRPFFFAVHPDFFYGSESQRITNETNIKALFEYLDGLKRCVVGRTPLLSFYVRRQGKISEGSEATRKVTFAPQGTTVKEAIESVLYNCGLLEGEALAHHKKQLVRTSDGTIDKEGLYRNSGSRSRFEPTVDDDWVDWSADDFSRYWELLKQKYRPSLKNWILSQHTTSYKHTSLDRKSQASVDYIITGTKKKYHLKDLTVESKWATENVVIRLQELEELLEDSAEEFQPEIQQLPIVLESNNGIGSDGRLYLDISSVPHQWYRTIRRSLGDLPKIKEKTDLEDRCALEMPTVNMKADHGINIEDYIFYLRTLTAYLPLHPKLTPVLVNAREDAQAPDTVVKNREVTIHRKRIPGIDVRICGPNRMSSFRPELDKSTGEIRVLYGTKPQDMLEFLEQNYESARAIVRENFLLMNRVETFRMRLKLRSLVKEQHVTRKQMEKTCRRLLKEHIPVEGLALRIGTAYQVYGNGDLGIPWDFQ